jgi:hypothetical protein
VPPYDHPDVLAGQAPPRSSSSPTSVALDALFVPLGGGGLLSGTLLAAEALAPSCRVYGWSPRRATTAPLARRGGDRAHRRARDDRRRRPDHAPRRAHVPDHPRAVTEIRTAPTTSSSRPCGFRRAR